MGIIIINKGIIYNNILVVFSLTLLVWIHIPCYVFADVSQQKPIVIINSIKPKSKNEEFPCIVINDDSESIKRENNNISPDKKSNETNNKKLPVKQADTTTSAGGDKPISKQPVQNNTDDINTDDTFDDDTLSTDVDLVEIFKESGRINGPLGVETYYNLPMDGVIKIMRELGYDEEDGYLPWIRSDGVRMFGDYIMVAADLSQYPRGSIVECSLGPAIVCDTGSFVETSDVVLDIATIW